MKVAALTHTMHVVAQVEEETRRRVDGLGWVPEGRSLEVLMVGRDACKAAVMGGHEGERGE